MNDKKPVHAPAVDRALDVIELLATSQKELPLSEILARLSIPRQSLIRILNTLCDRGIVDKTGQRGFYRLGMRLLYLGNRLQNNIRLRSVARPFMQELADRTHKTVELSTLDRDQLVLIEQIEGSEGIRLYTRIGSAYPYFHAVAVGKIYLAHMDAEKRHKVLSAIGLPPVTEHTLTGMEQLERELAGVREQGYAFEDQELRKGVRRIVAPIHDHQGHLAGGVGVAATIFSFEMEDKERLGQEVVETAHQISYRMGNKT
ncbi:MAG: IclR family transcriptional regulator [Deltaproteobacteria bacterium]|nr:IclR family transcriptional regulator [Deltaproteobacteria bacterium]